MSTTQVAAEEPQSHGPWRVAAVLGLSLPIFAWVVSQAPLAQSLGYHDFADQRSLYGVAHFWNVVSNLPFAVIGALGCWWLMRAGRTSPALEPDERLAYFVFFVGEFLTCFGSGYYHTGPTNETLVWDRLVFSLMLTSIFAIVVAEFVHRRVGRLMLTPMVVLGFVSVLYWARSEVLSRGDLRLYFLVQFYPMLAIPVILLLFRSRYTYAGAFWLMWVLYAVAKVAELYDGSIFEWSGVWSGHTVKHLVAAGASYIPLYSLQHRTNRVGGSHAVGHLARVHRERPANSFLARLTYGAMAVWGIGETMDSIPSLMGIFGLTFMVYSGAVWFLALVLAIGSSVPLMFQGPQVHRRRVVTWYFLFVIVGLSGSVGVIPRVAAEMVAAAMPILWLVRTTRHGKVGGTGPITPIATVALIALACAACGLPEPVGRRVFFIQPADGATVQSPVRLEFGVENFRIAPAPAGGWGSEDRPDLGHYHVAIDADCVSTRFTASGQPTIPPAAPWIHLDDGTSIIDMPLPPGPHRLTLQIGDDMNRTMRGLCAAISVTVVE